MIDLHTVKDACKSCEASDVALVKYEFSIADTLTKSEKTHS